MQSENIIAIFKRTGPFMGTGWIQGGGMGEVRFHESAIDADECMRSAHLFGPIYFTATEKPAWNPIMKCFDAASVILFASCSSSLKMIKAT